MADPVLVYIGTGIVATAKLPDVHTIEVYPQELLADANGNIIDSTNIGGLSQADLITAEYRFTDPYLTVSPMLVEGDVVTLLEHANTGVVYWQPHVRSVIRKVTKITHTYPAKKEVNINDDATNNYRATFDTEVGLLELVTTKARDEPVAYNIQLNTKDGKLSVIVDNGEQFVLDSVSHTLTVIVDKIEVTAKTVNIKGDTSIDGSLTVSGNIQSSKSIGASGNISSKASIRAGGSIKGKIGKFPNLD